MTRKPDPAQDRPADPAEAKAKAKAKAEAF